jgi:phosphatidylglycerol---prolipoprotein diacylglyceryl transferase
MHTTIQGTDASRVRPLDLSLRSLPDRRCYVRPGPVEFTTREGWPAFLDTIVIHANRVTIFGVRYKPYWIISDVAMAAALIYAWVFSNRFPNVSGLGLGVAVLGALLMYKLVLEIKAIFRKRATRSFLQDCLMIILPSFLVVSLIFRQPISLALAFLGTLIPLYGCVARIACFLGGCCFGKPSEIGVLYPASIFELTDHGCRRFSPSPNPGTRVFPIQLVESAAQATLFALMVFVLWQIPDAAWAVFWVYLSLYAIVRFVLDFYRTTSARPRYGRFSEAQLTCMAVQAVSLTVLITRVWR